MGTPHTVVMDQLILFMLPDRPLHVERRFARNKRPTIAPVVGIKGHVILINLDTSSRQRHGEELFELSRLELPVN